MGPVALAVATICYLVTATDLIAQKNYAMAGVWGAYAVANCFLAWATYKPQILAMVAAAL